MKQWGRQYRWSYESEAFIISDVDPHYYACKYLDSTLGFVIDKDAFQRQLEKGRIREYSSRSMAV
ncbi:hypothetical protein [Ammoniphilus sp. CFH 90114]|uniref:hypothetical protein n=1 Tax=Ammoniphilus sp. CFH 90114 TaxID=2493665 RepID=UPI00100DF4D5|nr:hypothetical protein [Ammoniphilus sp. CFH 90114]RXT05699.1 hypothetical protein EIZ39_16450 [Ammoniphilus sp. CFH 90114]